MTRVWIVTGACLSLAIGLVIWNQKPAGPSITVQFQQGHGLRPGNSLRHRGIDVGTVTAVTLTEGDSGVSVVVELQPAARQLAREDSQFWIVRPRVSLTRVSGLDTVVGARYIDVQPGSSDRPRFSFTGLETPLTLSGTDSVSISILFRSGHGLSAGDQVRHRGIVVGEVTDVDLTADLAGVSAQVRLVASARRLARSGAQFWIERPTVSAAEIRGLDTLVGGRYIAVQPGSADAAEQFEFEGVRVAPPGELPEGGLEIVLEASERGGLNRGVPILYRGMPVGHVISVALSSDSASIQARAWIEPAYRNLVRQQTRFWTFSGVNVSVGLKGVQLEAESLSSILVGGVSLATPENAGEAVKTGHRFECVTKPEDEWTGWQPRLATGHYLAGETGPLPQPVRGLLRWQERSFGFRRNRSRSSWLLVLEDGRLLGPAEMFEPVAGALNGQIELEVSGRSISIKAGSARKSGDLAIASAAFTPAADEATWPLNRIEANTQPVDCLVITSTGSELGIDASRLTMSAGALHIDASVSLNSGQHGAVVVARDSGRVIGVLLIDETARRIALFDKTP
jgi:paraquat-inducible protein B